MWYNRVMNYLDTDKELPGVPSVKSEEELLALVRDSIENDVGRYHTVDEVKAKFAHIGEPVYV